jgi:hypothetical protein
MGAIASPWGYDVDRRDRRYDLQRAKRELGEKMKAIPTLQVS